MGDFTVRPTDTVNSWLKFKCEHEWNINWFIYYFDKKHDDLWIMY